MSMMRATEDWHTAARLLVGTTRLERMPWCVARIATSVARARRRDVEARGGSLELAVEPAPAWVDPSRVYEMIERMVNRIERTTPAGGRIALRVSPYGDSVLVSVEGDAPARRARHELPPRRSARARPHDRTLTLAVVRGLAELHGGSAGADWTDAPCGARIWALLPRATPDGASSHDPTLDLRGVHVLLVDDITDAGELAATIVRLRGAHAHVTSSPGEAFEWLASAPVDVLVSDIAMPHEDGCALLRRALSLRPTLRAAALSALSTPEDRDRALAAGFERYLTKPVDPDELVRAVHSLAQPIPARGGPA